MSAVKAPTDETKWTAIGASARVAACGETGRQTERRVRHARGTPARGWHACPRRSRGGARRTAAGGSRRRRGGRSRQRWRPDGSGGATCARARLCAAPAALTNSAYVSALRPSLGSSSAPDTTRTGPARAPPRQRGTERGAPAVRVSNVRRKLLDRPLPPAARAHRRGQAALTARGTSRRRVGGQRRGSLRAQ